MYRHDPRHVDVLHVTQLAATVAAFALSPINDGVGRGRRGGSFFTGTVGVARACLDVFLDVLILRLQCFWVVRCSCPQFRCFFFKKKNEEEWLFLILALHVLPSSQMAQRRPRLQAHQKQKLRACLDRTLRGFSHLVLEP